MLVWLVVATLLTACGAGINEDLVATSTPYPVRSPVGLAATPGIDAGVGEVTSLVAAGWDALTRGDPAAAERAFTEVLDGDPSDPAAALGRAEARLRLGDLTGARADIEELLRATPEDIKMLLARGELLLRFGQHAAAAADFDAAIAREPGSVRAFVGRARAILTSAAGDDQQYERALEDYRRALTLDPSSADAQLGQALVFADRAEFDGDPLDWERALESLASLGNDLGDDDPRQAALVARAQLALGDAPAATQTIAAALDRGPEGTGLARLRAVEAAIDLAEADWRSAEEAARAAIDADPLAWDARYALVNALLGEGDAAAALKTVEELLSLLPDDGRGLFLKGRALAAHGQATEARVEFDAAAAALPASAVYQARVAEALDQLASDGTPTAGPTPTALVRLRQLDRETPEAGVVRLSRGNSGGAGDAAGRSRRG